MHGPCYICDTNKNSLETSACIESFMQAANYEKYSLMNPAIIVQKQP